MESKNALEELVVDTLVTWKCNLQCHKCCVPKEGPEGSLEQFNDFFRKLRATGVQRVVLTGGDPLVRSDIGDIAKSAKEAGLEVYLSTNGMLLKEKWEELQQYISWISISMDTPSAKSNEIMTGRGGAKQFTNTIDFLKYYDQLEEKTAKIKLATVITKVNKDEILELGKLIFRDQTGYRPDIWRLYQFSNQFSDSSDVDGYEYVTRNGVSSEESKKVIAEIKEKFPEVQISYRPAESRDESFIFASPDLTLTYPSGTKYISFGDSKEMGPDELKAALMSVRRIWDKIIKNREIYS